MGGHYIFGGKKFQCCRGEVIVSHLLLDSFWFFFLVGGRGGGGGRRSLPAVDLEPIWIFPVENHGKLGIRPGCLLDKQTDRQTTGKGMQYSSGDTSSNALLFIEPESALSSSPLTG